MSTKEAVIEMIRRLPDEATVEDIMTELTFRRSVEEGLQQLDAGQGVPHDEARRRFPDVVAALDELAQLPANWDSYGAGTIRHSSLLATLELLLRIMRENTPMPALVPTNRRTILVEWHTRGIDLEVEVHGSDRLHVAFEDSRDGTEWEAELGSDLTRLVECIERLSKRD
jgi:hypothetical protein